MDRNSASGRTGATRRTFLSASAATAVAVPLLSAATPASAATLPKSEPDADLRRLLSEIDPARIEATITRLVQFGTRHTSSSQTDPVRGIGAATAWVYQQMQAIAATSSGRMTVQQQSFAQPVSPNIPVPTTITNVIATLQGTASPRALLRHHRAPGLPGYRRHRLHQRRTWRGRRRVRGGGRA